MAFYEFEEKIAHNSSEQTTILKDIALSLEILYGRKSLKELRLEKKLKGMRSELNFYYDYHQEGSEKYQKLLKEVEEVEEELRKERREK